jgi:hypothetical protein
LTSSPSGSSSCWTPPPADRTRQYWERYLKGAARFRGVPMTGIRTAVPPLWHTEQPSGWPTPQLLGLARHWIGQPFTEDKLAATLLLAEHLAGRLTLEDGDALARPLAEGKLADWSSCDWYATRPCTPTAPQPSA